MNFTWGRRGGQKGTTDFTGELPLSLGIALYVQSMRASFNYRVDEFRGASTAHAFLLCDCT